MVWLNMPVECEHIHKMRKYYLKILHLTRTLFIDKEAPTFEVCPDNQTLNTEPGQAFAVATWQDLSVADNSEDVPEVACDPQSGSELRIGQTLVTCAAVDGSGNNNTCSFQISVEGKRIITTNKPLPFVFFFFL